MGGVLLAAADYGLPGLPIQQGYSDPRRIWLEADGVAWRPTIEGIIMPGATGFGLPPIEVISQPLPGVAGSQQMEVRVGEREVFLPIYLASEGSPQDFIDARARFEDMVWPLDRGATFRIVAQDHTGIRELPCTYIDGLTGDEGRTVSGGRWASLGVRFRASEPYWRAREDRDLPFVVGNAKVPFLGTEGAPNTAPWPRRLSRSVILGAGMNVNITSSLPVYTTVELTGPADSFHGSSDTGWDVRVEQPIPAGQTLRIVSDPRRKSIRLDGAPAAGMVARGSVLKPFAPGQNTLDVLVPGATAQTLLRLSWRPLYRSAWGGR